MINRAAVLLCLLAAASCNKSDESRSRFDTGGVPLANPSPEAAPMPMDTIMPDTAVVSDPTHKEQTDTPVVSAPRATPNSTND